ncbi:MAG: MotA/TolQ/ExbB proton channel family protein [Opitutales bacterium]|jgi:biopolymer transport protein ExbB|nr:MotA/TolQ/ExbB proton channel family protein [Opitutales bacterium]MDP4645240.1 MotA/TolQ/ExbB proton channel family protein [Opitutales bacterium]
MIQYNKPTLFIRLFVVAACLAFSSVILQAQDTTAPAAETQSTSSDDKTLMGTFKTGGLAMYPLLAFSIATVGLILYNAMTIRSGNIINQKALEEEVAPALAANDYAKAMEVCEAHSSPLLNILHNGLVTTQNGTFDQQVIDKAFDEAASVELAKPFVFINYLQVIASVSPMVGLLGTVSGMVKAFRTIAEQGMGKPELLADNISEALITTASGLCVAIPALIAYFYFKNKYGKIASEVAQVLGRTLRSAGNSAAQR